MKTFRISSTLVISSETGILPFSDPILEFPKTFKKYNDVALRIPQLLKSDALKAEVDALETENLNLFQFIQNASLPQLQRAYAVLATLLQAYAYKHPNQFPKGISIGLSLITRKIGIKPTQTYYSYVTQNWKRKDPTKGITLDNIEPILTFTDTPDEKGFIKLHVICEAKAGNGIVNALIIDQLLRVKGENELTQAEITAIKQGLDEIARSVKSVTAILSQMIHVCTPQVYSEVVRPYLLPFENFRGASGVQTSIFAILDRFVGIHAETLDIQDYRPADERNLINSFDHKRLINKLKQTNNSSLLDSRNAIIQEIKSFRENHHQFTVKDYYDAFLKNSIGTGATPHQEFLCGNIDKTRAALCIHGFKLTKAGNENAEAANITVCPIATARM